MKGNEFYDWLNTVAKVFAYKDLADHKKVKLVAIKLHRRPTQGGNSFKSLVSAWKIDAHFMGKDEGICEGLFSSTH